MKALLKLLVIRLTTCQEFWTTLYNSVHLQLPVSIYESVLDLVNGASTMQLVELQYTLATEEAERIGVDHVARMSSHDTQESSLGQWKRRPRQARTQV